MGDGLLFVLTEPKAGTEAAFHDWYDTEHGPDRLSITGITSGLRYRSVDRHSPTWLACYDVELSALESTSYRELRNRRSVRERAILRSLRVLDRRVYRLVDGPPELTPPARFLVAVSLSVPESHEQELAAWYREEHLPLLRRVPGWQLTTRYRLLDGEAPRHLSLHRIDDLSAFESEAYRHATSTPWREQIMSQVVARGRQVFALHNEIRARR